jgi:uncharacterized membrane protein
VGDFRIDNLWKDSLIKGIEMKNETIGYITDPTTCNLTEDEEEQITEELEEKWS